MAQLSNYNAEKYRYGYSELNQETTEPTLRDKIIHRLLEKQRNTNVNLEDVKKAKIFVKSSIPESTTSEICGLVSLDHYSELKIQSERIDFLKACHLTDSEIDVLIKKSGPSSFSEEYDNFVLKTIEEKLLAKEREIEPPNSEERSEKFSSSVALSRHEYEEECCRVPQSETASKLTNCLIHMEPDINPGYPVNHPIHQLPQLVKELFPVQVNNVKKKRKRREKTNKTKISKTMWDVKSSPDANNPNDGNVQENNNSKKQASFVYTIEPDKKLIDYSKPFIVPNTPNLLKPEKIRQHCLSLDKIKDMFPNYNAGVPSSTLYAKNLPKNLPSQCLTKLFCNFETDAGPRIVFRILKGRMNGQAFITLHKPQIAQEALSACNGFLFEDKPMILSFGKNDIA